MNRRNFVAASVCIPLLVLGDKGQSSSRGGAPGWRLTTKQRSFTLTVNTLQLADNEYLAGGSCFVRYVGANGKDLGLRPYGVEVPMDAKRTTDRTIVFEVKDAIRVVGDHMDWEVAVRGKNATLKESTVKRRGSSPPDESKELINPHL